MRLQHALPTALALAAAAVALAATTVPTDVQEPGTQPRELSGLESPTKCDNCHGGYDAAVEPATNWRGSMMAHSSRDPLFWAAMAVAEQDFDGAGDFCLRCHVSDGWVSGRSTPTDGSALSDNDASGVSCDLCHSLVNPDGTELTGLQTAPFVANDGTEGWLGSAMYVLYSGGNVKLGPYSDAGAKHQWLQSRFHRSVDFCGTCHDISNPVVGDLSPGHGTQDGTFAGTFSGTPGSPVSGKAAFNNAPYTYGIVERTFSEYKASLLSQTRVKDYGTLPAELQDGAIERAWQDAVATGTTGDYVDGTPRTFSCQTCHMRPVQGYGANKHGIPYRDDLPLHDLTGGNTWVPDAIAYLDGLGELVLGGGLDPSVVAAMEAGRQRAAENLSLAARMTLDGNTVTIVNLTGHKLISGYPEGRRMWLDVAWFDDTGTLLRHDGAYGPMTVTLDGVPTQVDSLLDLDDPYLVTFESHYAITQAWAHRLVYEFGVDPSLALAYDRVTGAEEETLGELADDSAGTFEETFHFALNDTVASDTRIPPYGMSYDEAARRNALPVPAGQYGDPGPGGVYDHAAHVDLVPPPGATWASIELKFQPTSWEYVQFLYLANHGTVSNLAGTGAALLDAWLHTGMAAPIVMASATWGSPPVTTETSCTDGIDDDGDGAIDCDDTDCAADPACATGPVCGDGTCEPGEDCVSCAADCDGVTNGKPSARWCCGNGVLESPEGDGSVCDGNY